MANPNCSTIQMVVALKPLHDLAGIKRIVVATYQASSGKGAKATAELAAQLHALGHGEKVPPVTVHAAQLAGNVLPHDWKLGEDGYSEEEIKMIKETKKIMGDDTIQVSPTTVRVPVRIGHSESINLEFARPITPEQAREALRKAPGVIVLDDYAKGEVPLALLCEEARRDVCGPGSPRSDGGQRVESVGGLRQSPQRVRRPTRCRSRRSWCSRGGCRSSFRHLTPGMRAYPGACGHATSPRIAASVPGASPRKEECDDTWHTIFHAFLSRSSAARAGAL